MVIGLLTIAAIPTVTGVAQGISSKKTQNAQMKEKVKFNMTATLAVDGGEPTEAWIVLRNGRVSSHSISSLCKLTLHESSSQETCFQADSHVLRRLRVESPFPLPV